MFSLSIYWWFLMLCLHGCFAHDTLMQQDVDRSRIKVLNVGKELTSEILPLRLGHCLYELHGLKALRWYEVKISYPASETSGHSGICAFVSVMPAGVVAKSYLKEQHSVVYNIVCDELLYGIPHQAWWVGFLVVFGLLISCLIPNFLPPELLPRKETQVLQLFPCITTLVLLTFVGLRKGNTLLLLPNTRRRAESTPKPSPIGNLALKAVAGISGLDFGEGDWGQLLESLEDAVFRSLKPAPLEVAADPDPVGLDEIIADLESFMESGQQIENEEVKIVGIVGFGGSGKTTLAKEFFNRKSLLFERSSFLFDLRDASSRNALPDLQRKLLQDLRVGDCKIDNVIEGKGIIRERLQSLIACVLIVLDDIDHPSQVEALAVKDVLGSDSSIIITSRDEEALSLVEASVYKIKALSRQHARDLFLQACISTAHSKGGI